MQANQNNNMKSNNKFGLLSNLKNDIPASIVVFLVAVPLCLGIALGSFGSIEDTELANAMLENNFMAGIIAGIIGGIVVAAISGSPLGVSGPAAGLMTIVAAQIYTLKTYEVFLLAVVLAGLIQILLGFLKAGKIGMYFPSSVIRGMLAGIGIVIIKKQIPYALGSYDKSFSGWFENISWPVITITLVSLIILLIWETPFMKRIKLFTIIQGPLVAVLSSIGLGRYFYDELQPKFKEVEQISDTIVSTVQTIDLDTLKLVNVKVLDSLGDIGSLFTFPDFSLVNFSNSDVYIAAITIAIVASLETLLCVEATDKIDPYKRITPTNRELIAQGAGNMFSGFIGGLPITQVIVRSSANIQSGGKTKMSAILHGILLFICVVFIPNFLNMIPLGCLAAILFVVGYKLAKPALFIEMYSKGWKNFAPYILTIFVIVQFDLLLGIGAGLVLSLLLLLLSIMTNSYTKSEENGTIKIILSENLTFLNRANIKEALDEISNDDDVIIDCSKTKTMHIDVRDIINDFQNNSSERSGSVKVHGL